MEVKRQGGDESEHTLSIQWGAEVGVEYAPQLLARYIGVSDLPEDVPTDPLVERVRRILGEDRVEFHSVSRQTPSSIGAFITYTRSEPLTESEVLTAFFDAIFNAPQP